MYVCIVISPACIHFIIGGAFFLEEGSSGYGVRGGGDGGDFKQLSGA